MYELQEDRIRRSAAEAEALFAEERTRVEHASRESRREEHHAVERLWEEALGFVAHETHIEWCREAEPGPRGQPK